LIKAVDRQRVVSRGANWRILRPQARRLEFQQDTERNQVNQKSRSVEIK
jgi:hypothetical protein